MSFGTDVTLERFLPFPLHHPISSLHPKRPAMGLFGTTGRAAGQQVVRTQDGLNGSDAQAERVQKGFQARLTEYEDIWCIW